VALFQKIGYNPRCSASQLLAPTNLDHDAIGPQQGQQLGGGGYKGGSKGWRLLRTCVTRRVPTRYSEIAAPVAHDRPHCLTMPPSTLADAQLGGNERGVSNTTQLVCLSTEKHFVDPCTVHPSIVHPSITAAQTPMTLLPAFLLENDVKPPLGILKSVG
jgi:hypothetical protein